MKVTFISTTIGFLLQIQSCEGYGTFGMKMTFTDKFTPATESSRRTFFDKSVGAAAVLAFGSICNPSQVEAIGPVKLELINPVYTAAPCPPSRPIPGEKAMKGMRGLVSTFEILLLKLSKTILFFLLVAVCHRTSRTKGSLSQRS